MEEMWEKNKCKSCQKVLSHNKVTINLSASLLFSDDVLRAEQPVTHTRSTNSILSGQADLVLKGVLADISWSGLEKS